MKFSFRVKNPDKVFGIIKYVFGVIGFFAIVLAILTVTGVVENYLLTVSFVKKFDTTTKLMLSLISSIVGIFCLFIAFSRQIDKFFDFLERHEIKHDKEVEEKGVTFESIFFFLIAAILITLAEMLGTGFLILKTELPLIGKYTKGFLIGALIVLSVLAVITAFNDIISQSVKEMKKVHWPTGKQMLDYSVKVFSFIIFFSLFFFALDLILSYAPKLPGLVGDLYHRIF